MVMFKYITSSLEFFGTKMIDYVTKHSHVNCEQKRKSKASFPAIVP